MNNRDLIGAYEPLLIYQRARRTFACQVFLLATMFILMAAAQWIPLLLNESWRTALAEHYYITYIVFFCALLTVTVFIFFERVRFMVPLNWILTIFIVECVTWGLARAVVVSRIDHFGYSFIAVMLVCILMVVIGGCMKHDLTMHVLLLLIGSIILFLLTIFCVLLYIIANIPYVAYFYISFVVAMVLMFLLYHSQTILGGRYAEMRIVDYLLASLIIFHDFVVLFILTFYLASHVESDS